MSEVAETQENMLVKLIDESGLEKAKAEVLKEKFSDMYAVAMDWKQKALTLKVTDISQETEMKMADEGRKFLKNKRVEIENTRKSLKEESLKEGRAIDALAKALTSLIEPIEEDLTQKAKFKEIYIKNLKEQKRLDRLELLRPLDIHSENGFDFANMDEATWETFYNVQKLAFEAEQERKRKELETQQENERMLKLHRERKESIIELWSFFPEEWKVENLGDISEDTWLSLVERTKGIKAGKEADDERIRLENIKLKEEQEKREAEQREAEQAIGLLMASNKEEAILFLKENGFEECEHGMKSVMYHHFIGAKHYSELDSKEELLAFKNQTLKENALQKAKHENDLVIKQQQEQLEAQRKANEKLQADLKAQQEKEAQEKAQRELEAKKAAAAPEKDKLLAYIRSIEQLPVPELSGADTKIILSEIVAKRNGFAKWATELVNQNI